MMILKNIRDDKCSIIQTFRILKLEQTQEYGKVCFELVKKRTFKAINNTILVWKYGYSEMIYYKKSFTFWY